MPHAQIENVITCAGPDDCVQPGTRDIPVAVNAKGDILTLEFCERHARNFGT